MMIAKPSVGCGGEGIYLLDNPSDIPRHVLKQWVVQKYVMNPSLIDNKKYDFRLYFVLTGIDDFKAYFSYEGIGRVCTEEYT